MLPVAVMKLLSVATDSLDGDKFTRLMTTSRFHVYISVSTSVARVEG